MNAQDLKNSILQLAVQGKLVEQRHEEGTAKELLAQIKAEKEQLIKDKKIKKEKPLPEIAEDEIPFDIPESWEWVRLVDIAKSSGTDSFADGPFGSNLKKEHQIDRPEVRIIQLSNIGDSGWKDDNVKYTSFTHLETISRCEVNAGDFIIAKMMPAGRTIIMPDIGTRVCLGSDAIRFVPTDLINKSYLLYAMKSYAFLSQIYSEVHGVTRVRTSLNKLKTYLLPVPPVEEQKRIVAKIEGILPYIEQYDRAYTKLEIFNKKFPEDMKKSILQMAMQGKLVEQRPEEGTADELYEQIVAEKTKLIKEGKIKKEKTLPEITDEEIPFEIPESWKWVRLGELSKLITKGSSPSWQGIKYCEDGLLFITSENVGKECLLLDNPKYVEEKFNHIQERSILQYGDILTNLVGASIGRTAIYNLHEIANINQAVCIIRLVEQELSGYILKYMSSYVIYKMMMTDKVDTARANISLANINNLIVPLPPLAEQKRIVAKLEQMLPYCEQLMK